MTAVDDKVLRGETARPQQRSRLLSWISGEYDEAPPTEVDAQAIAPPDPEVQREIRRRYDALLEPYRAQDGFAVPVSVRLASGAKA